MFEVSKEKLVYIDLQKRVPKPLPSYEPLIEEDFILTRDYKKKKPLDEKDLKKKIKKNENDALRELRKDTQ